MSEDIFVGIDCGTQSTKVIAYNPKSKQILAESSAKHDLISKDDGSREQDAKWWINALQECFIQIPGPIKLKAKAIGVSGQQHGFVPLDKSGNVLHPAKLWCDTSTSTDCTEIHQKVDISDAEFISRFGNLILPGYTASKIRWLKKYQPKLYNQLDCILLPHDYINFYLTGNKVMEYGDASGTGFLNIHTKTWATEILNAIDPERDLRLCLPKLINAQEKAGHLLPEIASILGLPPGILVSSGGGDNMMGAIGTGTVQEGSLTMSLGTSGTLYGYSKTPVIDDEGNLAAFCSSTGGYLPLLCTMNCTVATEEFRSLFNISLKEMDELAIQAPIGSEGVVVLPFFNGERTPNLPNGRACILGLTQTNHNKKNLMRASMESAIFALKTGLESFRKLGFQVSRINLIGGGANSPLWRQMVADVMEVPVALIENAEAAAVGAALQALWCYQIENGQNSQIEKLCEEHVKVKSNLIMPNKSSRHHYVQAFQEYQKYLNALAPLFK